MAKKIEVFASEAQQSELENFPDIKRGWGVTKSKTGGIPPMKWYNAIQKRTDEAINQVAKESINGYTFKDGGVADSQNDWFEHEGNFYYRKSGFPHTVEAGKTPETDGGVWSEANPDGGWFIATDIKLRGELPKLTGGIAGYQSSNVNSMLQGLTTVKNVIALKVGQIWSSGGTKWELASENTPISTGNFRAFSAVYVADYSDLVVDGDWSYAVQKAVDEHSEIVLPPFEITFKRPVNISKNRTSISAINGATTITLDGVSEGAFRPISNFKAEVVEISGVTFQSKQKGVGSGIYSPHDVYLSHWDIHHCVFSQSLRYGIFANTVGCTIRHNDFGKSSTGSNTFAPIVQNGQPIGQQPELNPNANRIHDNWIKRASNVEYAVELGWGVMNIVRDNLFEQNNVTVGTILCDGAFYPKFNGNYFERNTGSCLVKFRDSAAGGRSVHFVNFNDNYIKCDSGLPSETILDFEGCSTDAYSFDGILVANTPSTMKGLIKGRSGEYDEVSKCSSCEGLHVTGALKSPLMGRTKFIHNTYRNYAGETRLIGERPKYILSNTAGNTEAALASFGASSVRLEVPKDGNVVIQSGGVDKWEFRADGTFRPVADGDSNIGSASNRVRSLYLVNNPTVTSDRNLKASIESVPDVLLEPLLEIIGSIKLWKWISSVKEKGDNARKHSGIIAQDVYAIFARHNIDAFEYGFIGRDKTDDGEIWSVRGSELQWLCLWAIGKRQKRIERRLGLAN